MTDEVAVVQAARDRVIAAGTAHVSCVIDRDWTMPEFPAQQRRGPVRRALLGAGKTAGKTVGKGVWRVLTRHIDLRHQTAEGFIDFSGRRFMIDFGNYAMLEAGNQEWSGRSGRELSTLPASGPRAGSPLWLIDLVGGLTSVEDLGTEQVGEQTWRRFTTIASLADASANLHDGMLPVTTALRACSSYRSTCGWTTRTCGKSDSSMSTRPRL